MIQKERKRKVFIEFREFNKQLYEELTVEKRFPPFVEKFFPAFSLEARIIRIIEKRRKKLSIQMGRDLYLEGIVFNFDKNTTPPTLHATAVI